jgi:hypothetical protein
VSLLHGPEAPIDAGIVGDIELNELSIECVGGRAPSLLVARSQDRSETVLDQLPHDLATDPSIRTRNKRESTLVRHRPSRSHPRRLRPGGILGPPERPFSLRAVSVRPPARDERTAGSALGETGRAVSRLSTECCAAPWQSAMQSSRLR